MVEVEIDGRKVEMPEGSMVMHAANALGIYVPHFCYHKKLSIAANCRMCLVEVEKAPKPLPACATPVANGMKVWTASEKAVAAQKSVMEFLLINHPLDCPICDQGGECQLQDLAVGYGKSASRYSEAKRVVFHKPMGPLISAEEMTRCIHCTRCVRFGQEIAGVMELGMAGRGEHSEIMSFVGRSIDSELSGNMIDLCPVGALTSKPFRYSARTWELSRRKSVAPHDSLGSNLVVQVKLNRVMRVLPLENEAVNECWLSDRDRFSYEGLNSDQRLTRPMLKQDGKWHEVDWETALEYAAHALGDVRTRAGGEAIGVLASPASTLAELSLAGKLARALGSDNVDFRLRHADFSADGKRAGVPWLGMPVAEIESLDRLLLVGSFLRKDHPLVAARVRQAVKHGARVSAVHAVDEDLLMPLAERVLTGPADWHRALAAIGVALAEAKGMDLPEAWKGVAVDDAARTVAASLASGKRVALWLGNAAVQHPEAAALAAAVQWIAQALGARWGVLGEAANSVGGYLADALPRQGGMAAGPMLASPRRAYLLMGCEPDADFADPQLTRAALASADTVIALSAFRSDDLLELADCLLPIAPFTETAGTFVSCEGRAQTFNGVVRPLGEARPAWKVLRVLGNLVGASGFDYDSSEAVRDEVLGTGELAERLSNAIDLLPQAPATAAVPHGDGAEALTRLADVPIYFVDPLVRRAESLQQTTDARAPRAVMPRALMARLGIAPGDRVRVRQSSRNTAGALEGEAVLEAAADDRLAPGTVRIAAAHPSTARLGGMFAPVTVEPAGGQSRGGEAR